jgi:hypothetical protein
VWAIEVLGTVLPATGKWEHEGTSTAVTAGSVGDGPTVAVKDDATILLAECKPNGTSVEHLQNYLQKVLT